MLRLLLLGLPALLGGCIGSSGPLLGIMSPDSIDARYLRVRNLSKGYVSVRVYAPGAEPLVTGLLPPGAQEIRELSGLFGTLCPGSLRIEIAGYARVSPQLSPLVDETVQAEPFAAFPVELVAWQHYGCSADLEWVDLDSMIDCAILDVDEEAGAVGFQAGWLAPQRQSGLHLEDPPAATVRPYFALDGRVVNTLNQPLANVEIRFPQLGASVFTDAYGRFRVFRPAGAYAVEPVLPGIEVSPTLHNFTHLSTDQVPIEFIALTDQASVLPDAGE